MRKIVTIFLGGSVIVAIFHFAWEMIQMPLYQSDKNWFEMIPVCFIASLGDVMMTLLIFGVFAIIYKDWYWFRTIHFGKYFGVAFIGLLFAIVFEQFAMLTSRWEYTELMPTIPVLNVGISPLLQMVILTPLFLYFINKFFANTSN